MPVSVRAVDDARQILEFTAAVARRRGPASRLNGDGG
jgi:hypothetical protein